MRHASPAYVTDPRRLLLAFSCILGFLLPASASADFAYSVYDGTFSLLPDFSGLTPTATATSTSIGVGVTSQTDTFALAFTNTLNVPTSGDYEFMTNSDDGSRVYIDGALVVDNDGLHAPAVVVGSVSLAAGTYALRVEFFENQGGEVLDVGYRSGNPAFEPIPADGQLSFTPFDRSELGEWGGVIGWPEIAISAANLPDGRILTWSSTETNAFPSNTEFTHASVFDPATTTFETVDSNFHDMFCAGVASLENGQIIAAGGNPQDRKTSSFDPATLSWTRLADMNDERWYATAITMPSNQIFSSFGKGAANRSERYDPAIDVWTATTNANMQTLVNEQNAINGLPNPGNALTQEWFSHLAVTPQGDVFQGGPTPTWHRFDPVGGAANVVLGQPIGDVARMYGNAVTYDEGKVLLVGGSDRRLATPTSVNNVYRIDLSGPAPVVTAGTPMNFPRALSNSVTLPNGEVLVIGGNTVARIFTDEGAVLPAEIYNPSTDTWRVVDAITIPRNYHSTALLMKDARVLSAGGGACGNCNANHLDGQIYSPPYLFESDDTPAIRPTLTVSGTPQVRAGENLVVTASSDTVSFSIVRLSATTHHMNTDQRFMPVASIDNQNGTFDLTFSANPNVLIVGNYWLFALDVDGTPSLGQTIQVIRDLDPPIDDSVYVSDLAWESEQNFFGPAERDQSNGEDGAGDGNTLELEGVQYAKGIGVHAYSEIAVRLDGLYDRFRSDIGLDDERDALCGDVHFRIDLDGLNVYSSGNFVDTTPTESVDLDVSGSTIMTLKVQDNGATCGDHADWADARLTPTPLPGYRYYRFRSTKLRDDVGANAIQLAELSLFLQSFRQSATTVLNPGGNNPPSEGPSSADDADVNTKWLDFNRGALVYDFGLRVEIDAYSFTTANDADDRDPVRWVFEGSQNGVGWEILDDRSSADYPTPTARLTSTGIFDVELLDVISPLPEAPRNSSTLIVETSNNDEDRIWNVNPDNDSVSVLDAAGTLLTEIGVGDAPWALAKRPGANRVYVTNKRSATITVLDTQTLDVDHTVDLARGSQPHGIVFSADGSHYYVVLEALARLEKRASIDDSLVSNLTLGGTPRHLGMRFDDSRVIVSDFITPPIPGESTLSVDVANGISNVFVVDPTSLTLTTTIPITYDDRGQSESQGPGMPNYLGPPVVSFDELYAYIPSKKDNIAAGALRQIPGLGFESTVRANSSRILLGSETEDPTFRVDHDNAGLATGAALSGDGRYLFVTLETSRELAVYDTINGFQLMRLPTGRAPQSVALSSDGSIAYVHDFMDRQISRFDLTDMLQTHLPSTNALGPVSVVTTETLAPDVLLGKQHFYDGEDDRISLDNYISCASCHSDGGHDGRVWDFGGFGEGLRSTPSLRGHGEEHGLSHWSGNFDEIQDFDIQFRNLALGLGFLTITQHNATLDPLGAPKAGMNTDLDALAAYLAFLTDPPESPHRPNATSLSASALQGQSDFGSLGCLGCHAQPALNDSSLGLRHDVGTIDTASGSRLGGTLDGFDTPGLLGIWLDPPYLHDGSAATIGDAITSHTAFSGLAPATVDSLVDFLREAEPADMLDFDTDGDGTLDVDDPDVDDPCIPMVFVAVCLADTDNDGTTDFDEGEGVDSDGDGLFDFEESSILDSDGDTVVDQDDATNNDGCFPDPMFCPAAPVDATTPVGQILLVLLLGLAAPILYRHEKGWNRN